MSTYIALLLSKLCYIVSLASQRDTIYGLAGALICLQDLEPHTYILFFSFYIVDQVVASAGYE